MGAGGERRSGGDHGGDGVARDCARAAERRCRRREAQRASRLFTQGATRVELLAPCCTCRAAVILEYAGRRKYAALEYRIQAVYTTQRDADG